MRTKRVPLAPIPRSPYLLRPPLLHPRPRRRAPISPASCPAAPRQKAPRLSLPCKTTSKLVVSVTAPAPVSDFSAEVKAEIFRRINAERAKAGLGRLAPDARLDAIARAHSADMLAKGYFSHTDKNGCDSSCRVDNAGYAWSYVGENIYTMRGYELSAAQTAQKMVTDWMNSPGHRANILKPEFTNHGVGIAVSGSTIYATSEFAKPK